MECEFCKKTFKTVSILNNHKKTARYCLDIQNKKNNEFSCSYCDKLLTTKNKLIIHENRCKEKNMYVSIESYKSLENQLKDKENQLKDTIERYESQIKELQNQLASIARSAASKPTHIQNNNNRINNIINNLLPITDDHLKEQAQFLTIEHIKKGASGYARYALDYPLKDRIYCSDFARKKVNYKDSEGNMVSDPEMNKLCDKIFDSIEERNTILTMQYIDELKDMLNTLNNNPNNSMNKEEALLFEEQSNKILEYFFKCKEQMKDISKAVKGEMNDLVQEFVKDICLQTTT